MRPILLFMLAWVFLGLRHAAAEDLVAGISRDRIEINSSFTGAEVVVFGAMEGVPVDGSVLGRRDVVVVIRSDTDSVATVRRKDLLGPVWVNRESRQFANVPQFYFVASTRPLSEIAPRETLQQFELGYSNLTLGPAPGTSGGPKAFRDALLRSQAQSSLYTQHEGAVTFLSGSLFRTTASLPPNVPSGNLKVSVYAFAGGQVVSSNSMTLFIDKTGIERALSTFAGHAPILYGLLVVLLSVLSGFLASVAFRERH